MVYRRHLRHGNFDRVRHSDDLLDFLTEQAIRISGVAAGTAVTFANATNAVSQVGHGYTSGDGPFLLSSGGTLPAELDGESFYWVNVVDVDTFTLHTTESDAVSGTNVVAFTDDGTGTHSIHVAVDQESIFQAMKDGKTAEQVRNVSAIEEL